MNMKYCLNDNQRIKHLFLLQVLGSAGKIDVVTPHFDGSAKGDLDQCISLTNSQCFSIIIEIRSRITSQDHGTLISKFKLLTKQNREKVRKYSYNLRPNQTNYWINGHQCSRHFWAIGCMVSTHQGKTCIQKQRIQLFPKDLNESCSRWPTSEKIANLLQEGS